MTEAFFMFVWEGKEMAHYGGLRHGQEGNCVISSISMMEIL